MLNEFTEKNLRRPCPADRRNRFPQISSRKHPVPRMLRPNSTKSTKKIKKSKEWARFRKSLILAMIADNCRCLLGKKIRKGLTKYPHNSFLA